MLALLGMPLALLLSIEGILRLGGYGYSPHFFVRRDIDGRQVWTDNQDFGRRFFPPGLVRSPRSLTFSDAKPPNTLRIFVLGESAAMGDPDYKFGLPRMLEVLLRERFPQSRFEVVNAAMAAISSHVILPIARDCAQRQGDLWVVYMGNNEMIGPFGSASVFGARAPALPFVRAGLALKTSRLGQLLDAGLCAARQGSQPLPEWTGMEMMANQKLAFDATATLRVHEHFARNLNDVLETGVRAGVPIVLCTVATNLKDCAPFASLHNPNLAAAALTEWQAAYDGGVALQKEGKLAEAKTAFERAALIDDAFAELAYRRGQCSRWLGQDAQAATCFREARDKDALQFRADGQVNESIRRAAASFSPRRVSLVDAEKFFATNSPQGITGAEYFYEHVHLLPEGNYLLARAVAEQVVKALGLQPSGEWVSESECLRLLGFTDWNRYDALSLILDRVQGPPFTHQVDHADQLAKINDQLARYRFSSKPAQVKRDLQHLSSLVARYPEDPDLRWNLATLLEVAGDPGGAEREWRALLRLQPQAAPAHFKLAKLLDALGRQADALPVYGECLRLDPDYYPARAALGLLCLRLDRVPEAIRHLKLAVRQKSGSAEAHLALGQALIRAQRAAEAKAELRTVLRLDPSNAQAQSQLRELEPSALQ